MSVANLVNAENISKSFGTRTLLTGVSVGLSRGEVIGVVGRNGDGKSTLLRILTQNLAPDTGRVTITNNASIGVLSQSEDRNSGATIRDLIVGGAPDHVWASDSSSREIVGELLADLDLDTEVTKLSGGELRRAALVGLLLA
ncbi:MAG: glycerophosphodiester phosphodiesterase, partial [Propionibacterium sp.]